jgi:hypothetical protein
MFRRTAWLGSLGDCDAYDERRYHALLLAGQSIYILMNACRHLPHTHGLPALARPQVHITGRRRCRERGSTPAISMSGARDGSGIVIIARGLVCHAILIIDDASSARAMTFRQNRRFRRLL